MASGRPRRHAREMAALEAEFAEARRLADRAGGDAKPPVERLAVPTEDDVRAVVNAWLHGECRKPMRAEVPEDFEAVVDNLNPDEANLAGPGGRWPPRTALAFPGPDLGEVDVEVADG